MNYVGKIISNISQAYSEINPATLTGSIDLIVVEQEDGSFLTSPFHVRFGKMGVLRSKEKIVDIEINGQPVDIHMKLGDSGEAYFLEECDTDDEEDDLNEDDFKDTKSDSSSTSNTLIEDQKNSRIQNQTDEPLDLSTLAHSIKDAEGKNQSDLKATSTNGLSNSQSQKRTRRKRKGKQSASHSRQLSMSESIQLAPTTNEISSTTQNQNSSGSDLHPFSDSEAESKKMKEPITPVPITDYRSDSELEISKITQEKNSQDTISWGWGELPEIKTNQQTSSNSNSNKSNDQTSTKSSVLGGVLNFMIKDETKNLNLKNQITKHLEEDKGIYLDELDPNDMKPEVAAKYFPKFRTSLTSKPSFNTSSATTTTTATSSDEDIESGKGPSLSNSPRSADLNYSQMDMQELIERNQLLIPGDLSSFSQTYHDLSMSLCGRCEELNSNPERTELFLQSIISFDDFSENPLQILENPNLVIRMGSRYYSWKMASAMIVSLLLFQRPLSERTMNFLKEKCIPKKSSPQNSRSWRSWFRSSESQPSNISPPINVPQSPTSPTMQFSVPNDDDQQSFSSSPTPALTKNDKSPSIDYVSDEEIYSHVVIASPKNSTTNFHSANRKIKYRKVLRLSSDVLKNLNLKPGSNDIQFSVTTAYQGTTACQSRIFLWRYDDKIIISDIDGTITKSDVLGHILPYIGKDWAQSGVTNLFSKVQQNGYKFLYLSARAIGQAKGTRDYLQSICQDGVTLPEGPLLLSPTSLFSALHREVIEKKPEEFKIACLKDIQTLFPINPFFSGFGNKVNDTFAYKSVGIDPSRIFTINHRGELKLDKMMSFKSSYSELSQFVDQMFPPLNKDKPNQDSMILPDDFSSFMFWRMELPILDENDLDTSSE